jgi:hypothetical protein
MEYFGCLNEEMFSAKSTKEQDEILLSSELFESGTSFSGDFIGKTLVLDASGIKEYISPSKSLLNDCYEFILVRYKEYIENPFFTFFMEFEKEIYGLESIKQKRIALQHFNERYTDLKMKADNFARINKSDSGIKTVQNFARTKQLFYARIQHMKEVCDKELVLQYLYGNLSFFDYELMNNHDGVNEAIFFESQLKILISLNDRYEFEVDEYFTESGILLKLFSQYDDIFIEFPVFRYVHKKIKSIKSNEKAEIESLFVALIEKGKILIRKPSKFNKYLQNEFGITAIRLRDYSSNPSDAHENRVKVFKRDLEGLETK